jgi:hypothetical protein
MSFESPRGGETPNGAAAEASEPPERPRRTWIEPIISELPPLTSLTLQTGGLIGGDGGTGSGGSTVF